MSRVMERAEGSEWGPEYPGRWVQVAPYVYEEFIPESEKVAPWKDEDVVCIWDGVPMTFGDFRRMAEEQAAESEEAEYDMPETPWPPEELVNEADARYQADPEDLWFELRSDR